MTEESPLSSFGAWLKHERTEADLFLTTLAEHVGISREMVRLLENNKRTPSVALTIALAAEFDQNAWQILAHFGILHHETLRALANVKPPEYIPRAFAGFS